MFPQTIALGGLYPLKKVKVDYEPLPKNKFIVTINYYDYYTLVKEELDFDPSNIKPLNCTLYINDVVAHEGVMPWIIDEVEEKMNTVYQGYPLESL